MGGGSRREPPLLFPKFMFNGTSEQVLEQKSDRGHVLPFALDGQQIVRIGIRFDKETRNINQYQIG